MKLIFEKIFPYLLAALAALLWLEGDIAFPKGDSLLSATLTVSGIFVGFLATSKAILMSMNSPIIEELKKSGYINDLVSYIGEAIWVNLAFCSLNVAGYFFDTAGKWFSVTWIAVAVCSLLTFMRVTNIMLKIFKHS